MAVGQLARLQEDTCFLAYVCVGKAAMAMVTGSWEYAQKAACDCRHAVLATAPRRSNVRGLPE